MYRQNTIRLIALSLSGCVATMASAHITLPPGGAPAGSVYEAAFKVGHPCPDASATTGIKVRLPEGFSLIDAQARPGWTLATGAGEVSWVAASPQDAVPSGQRTTFVLRGKLPDRPGTLWFKVLQTCDKGSMDWAEVPGPSDTGKPSAPAARLDVLPASAALPASGGAEASRP